ncbi:MAG TPA: DUF3500 domain-containing protein [Bacteroidota bacterium]
MKQSQNDRSAGFLGWAAAPFVLLFFAADSPGSHPMLSTARMFIESLDQRQRGQALLPFDDSERTDWSYLPGRRKGLHFGEMNDKQKSAALSLLRSTLSEQGFLKTKGVMELEGVLRELEGEHRNPGHYWLTIFGSPSESSPWGWRLEGHHLSLNFSSASSELIAATPAFFGANPATVPDGPLKGLRVLAAEEDEARGLVVSLDLNQKRKAFISTRAPRDIITGTDRKAGLSRFEGIPFSDLRKSQQDQLLALLRLYIDNMEPGIAEAQWRKIQAAGVETIHFAWAGTIVSGNPHYYRIHGPTFLVEFDNTQNNANHVHSVWRDFEGDFGEDLLRKHYEEKSHRE